MEKKFIALTSWNMLYKMEKNLFTPIYIWREEL